MIWEVDEDCDQCLTWNEFQAMYHRCNNDKTGKRTGGLLSMRCSCMLGTLGSTAPEFSKVALAFVKCDKGIIGQRQCNTADQQVAM